MNDREIVNIADLLQSAVEIHERIAVGHEDHARGVVVIGIIVAADEREIIGECVSARLHRRGNFCVIDNVRKRGDQYRGEDRDDCDHDHEFCDRKCLFHFF